MAPPRLTDDEYQRRLEERFWAKVRRGGPDDCWEWFGAHSQRGYGALLVGRYPNKFLEPAHRVSLRLAGIVVPPEMLVLHKCDHPPCVNPHHLFVGTQLDNIRDMDAKGRRVRKGSPGEAHPNAKFTEEDIRQMRRLYGEGVAPRHIRRAFNVSDSHFHRIIKCESWPAIRS